MAVTRKRRFVGSGVKRLVAVPPGYFGAPPVTGYQLWLDGDDPSTITQSGGLVSAWADKSANGYDASQSTDLNKPLWGARMDNGRRGLMFNGASFMASSCPDDDRTSTSFVVATLQDAGNYRVMLGASGSSGNQFRCDQTSRVLHTEAQGVTAMFSSSAQAPTLGVNPFVAAQALSATSVEHRLNLTSESTSNSTTFTAGRTLVIGMQPVSTFPWIGFICEVIRYDSTLSSGDVDLNVAWLMDKWGV